MGIDLHDFFEEAAFRYDLSPIPGLEECKGVLPEPPRAAVDAYQRTQRQRARETLADLQDKRPEEITSQDIIRALSAKTEKELEKIRKDDFELTVALCSGSFPGARPLTREELQILYNFPRAWDRVQLSLVEDFLAGPRARSDTKPSLEVLKGEKRSAS